MSKITDIIKNPGIIGKYINGVIHAKCKKEQVYQLAFVKEDNGGWYIDLPEWTGSHANLAMVAGSDDLLNHLLKTDNRVEIEVVKSDKPLDDMGGYFCCKQIDMTLTGGATYTVHGVPGFDRTIWICPVTLFVLGEYPKYIYVRQTK